jgi:hypothetical protein
LRAAIDRLPLEVRQAMLEGIDRRPIIAGAHTGRGGGACPLVAADLKWQGMSRERYELALDMALAWDRYTETVAGARRVSPRQLLALRSMIEASILGETTISLQEAVADHQQAVARRRPARKRADTGERSRVRELIGRPGWAWTRPVRSYAEYEAALGMLADCGSVEAARALAEV